MTENIIAIDLKKNFCFNQKPISEREREVLTLIAYEFTSTMIAKKLFLSPHTVISHRQRLMEKFGVSNSAGLVRRGFELGILRVDGRLEIELWEKKI